MSKADHVSFSRRQLLAGAAASAGLAGSAAFVPALAKAPMLNTPAPSFYRIQARNHRGDGGVGRAVVDRRAVADLSRPDAARARQDVHRSFSADRQRRARPERAGDQYRRQACAVRHRHEHGEAAQCANRPAAAEPQAGRHRPEGHRCGRAHPSAYRPLRRDARGRRQPHVPQRAGLHAADRLRLLDGRQADGHAGGRLRHDGAQEPAALPGSHHLHQGRPGNPARRAGDAHARSYGRPHGLHDHVGRQDHLQYRRRRPPCRADRQAAHRGLLRHRLEARRGVARQAVRPAGGAADPGARLSLPWPGIGHLAKQGDGFRFFPTPMQLVL